MLQEKLVRYFNFSNQDKGTLKLDLITNACEKMASEKLVHYSFGKENNLDFLTSTGDEANIEVSSQILEAIFFKTAPSRW